MATKTATKAKLASKGTSGGNSGNSLKKTIDLAPMRTHIDYLKAEVNSLPEGKQKSALMTKIEDFYFWAGNYFRELAGPVPAKA